MVRFSIRLLNPGIIADLGGPSIIGHLPQSPFDLTPAEFARK
jgi:hypothetical protein